MSAALCTAVEYNASRVWEDEQGRNRAGAVLIQEQRVFAARAVQKADARPRGYVATGRPVNWIVDADIAGFFDTVRHDWLIDEIPGCGGKSRDYVPDRRISRARASMS